MKNKCLIINLFFLAIFNSLLFSNDLEDIKKSGELRHIGIPYANFVTGLGDGLDVEIIKGFSKHLGLEYKYVPSTWSTAFGDLIGQNAKNSENGVVLLDKVPVKGDLIANGLTILNWREEIVNFSDATFPSGVWLIARSDSNLTPIKPTESIKKDINIVKKSLSGKSILAIEDTCLDPKLYKLNQTTKAKIILKKGKKLEPFDLVPAVLKNDAEATLLDVPDALIALEKWPGEIKVIGPISQNQTMGVAFRKTSPQLLEEFNIYFKKIREDGTYNKLVQKYYPDVFQYYEDFFK